MTRMRANQTVTPKGNRKAPQDGAGIYTAPPAARRKKHYKNGRKAEYEARDILISEGYAVMRAAGSKGAADLCGVRVYAELDFADGPLELIEALWVSCKRGTGRADKAQRERLAQLPGRREIWTRKPKGVWEREAL